MLVASTPRLAFLSAVALAALQIWAASRWPTAVDHLGAVALAWAVALWLAWDRRPAAPMRSFLGELAVGSLVAAGSVVATVLCIGSYRPIDRVLPLAAGLGIVMAGSGFRGLIHFRTSLAVLGAVPLLSPLPHAIRDAIPLEWTAAAASIVLSLTGLPAVRDRTLLHLSGSTLEVLEGCSGLGLIGQLLALSAVVLALFASTPLQKLGVVASAVAAGFSVNASRVAFLTWVNARSSDDVAYWDRYGEGSIVFPILATALVGLCWWLIMRPPRRRGDAAAAVASV